MSLPPVHRFQVYHQYLKNNLKRKQELYKNTSKRNFKTGRNPSTREQADIVIMIPVWGRHHVLRKVFQSLRIQTIPHQVLAVISTETDKRFCENEGVDTAYAVNHPLGEKFQIGVYEARKYNPKALMILGSDDLLSKDYLEKSYSHILKGFDLVGTNHWIIYRNSQEVYKASYKRMIPERILGAGRIFSRKFLDRFSWKIYDKGKNANLDIKAENIARRYNKKIMIMSENTFVISFKGEWQMLHSFENMKKSSQFITLRRIKSPENLLTTHINDTWQKDTFSFTKIIKDPTKNTNNKKKNIPVRQKTKIEKVASTLLQLLENKK